MKSTILSQKDSQLLETLIAKYGLFVNFAQIFQELIGQKSYQEIKNLISKLIRQGWLVRIKKGTYHISTMESRGSINVSVLVIAQALAKDSYVSCEAALQYHGMFDQYLRTITSVSFKRHKTKDIQGIIYEFVTISKNNYYGWKKIQLEGREVKLAEAEKAILDILNFKRKIYMIDLVLEKLKEYQHDLSLKKLNEFSKKQSLTVQRILGFLLDKTKLDSAYIYDLIKEKQGSSKMTKDSKNFNAKWRLYYHNHFK